MSAMAVPPAASLVSGEERGVQRSVQSLASGAKVLVLRSPSDAAALAGAQDRFEGAIVDGLLEHQRWDRWLLQRVHKALRPGASIVVSGQPSCNS